MCFLYRSRKLLESSPEYKLRKKRYRSRPSVRPSTKDSGVPRLAQLVCLWKPAVVLAYIARCYLYENKEDTMGRPLSKGFLEGAIHHRRSSDRELNPKTRKNFSECCGFLLLLFIDLKNHCPVVCMVDYGDAAL